MGNQTQQPPRDIKLFAPGEVCSFPANSRITQFHFLGGGSWRAVSNGDAGLGFSCGAENNKVRLFVNGHDFINVEYTATGSERGASVISIVYTASASQAIDNEATYRTVFANFVNEISHTALKQQLPELARRKILNLNSYSPSGSENSESFFIGDGFITILRTRGEDNSNILVKTRIYPDKALKLE